MILKEEKEKWKKEQDRDRRRKTNGKEGRKDREKGRKKKRKKKLPSGPILLQCMLSEDEVARGEVILWSHNSVWKAMGTWQARKKVLPSQLCAKFPMAIEEPIKLSISKGFSGGASGR